MANSFEPHPGVGRALTVQRGVFQAEFLIAAIADLMEQPARKSPFQIGASPLSPGFFLTEQNRFLMTDDETGQLTQRGGIVQEHIPIGRLGCPEDLSGV